MDLIDWQPAILTRFVEWWGTTSVWRKRGAQPQSSLLIDNWTLPLVSRHWYGPEHGGNGL
jgi:hypothetical protein